MQKANRKSHKLSPLLQKVTENLPSVSSPLKSVGLNVAKNSVK